jgi:signal transduction histidine kinase
MQQAKAGTAVEEAGQPITGVAGMGVSATGRKRVEAVVETLANLGGKGESLSAVAHDARNMVTALGLYCDLLQEPGVLYPAFQHYAGELRLVATASRRLVEKLVALDSRLDARMRPDAGLYAELDSTRVMEPALAGRLERDPQWSLMPPEPIRNLAGELLANRNLLSALAGPSVALTVDVEGGAQPVRMTGEDLTRILVNLVKNAAEAMPKGGRIAISLREFEAGAGHSPWMKLTIDDNGDGIPHKTLEKIFDAGYTTRANGASTPGSPGPGGWPTVHRGLGLSITRSIIEASGGWIHAAHRAPCGARFEIELPVFTR